MADEKGITIKGLEAAKASDCIFMETYTSALSGGSAERLKNVLGKEITHIDRERLEAGTEILDKSRNETVALLVPGDAMSATTHVDLRLRALEMGISTQVIAGVSALTAVPALLGLQIYKFGRTVTIPIPQPNFSPTSFYGMALENFSAGLHTLCLLDIMGEENRYMTANEAFEVLASVEAAENKGFITNDRLVCVVAKAGHDDALVMAGFLGELRRQDFGPPMHSIVIPGMLHFMEAQALVKLAGAPECMLEE